MAKQFSAQRRAAIKANGDPVEAVATAYQRGATIPMLAKEYNVATGTIWHWLRCAGVPRKLWRRQPTQLIDDIAAVSVIRAVIIQAQRDAQRCVRTRQWLETHHIPVQTDKRRLSCNH